MNLFLDAHTLRAIGNITAAIEALPRGVAKARVWEEALKTLFSAHNYAHCQIEKKRATLNGRFYEPPDIRVEITRSPPNARTRRFNGSRPWQNAGFSNIVSSHGQVSAMVYQSSEQMLAETGWIEQICRDFTKYADTNLGRGEVAPQPDAWEKLPNAPSPFVHHNPLAFLKLEPLFDAIDAWPDGQSQPTDDAKLPRWVWLAKTCPQKGSCPYVYLYWPGSREVLRPWNPQGQRLMVFDAVEHGSPWIAWNYAKDKNWKAAPHEKKLFIQRADADHFPHLLYVPVFRWLALQYSFGPDQNPIHILDDAYRLARFAPLIFLNCFRDAVFRLVLRFFSENTEVHPGAFHTDRKVQARVSEIVRFIVEQYPTPLLRMGDDGSLAHFAPCDPADSLASAFAQHGNSSLELAIAAAASKAEVTDYRNVGVTMMGTLHTLKRPVQQMTSYVQRVMKEQQLSADLHRESTDVLTHLAGVRVFAELEVRAYRPLLERSFRLQPITPQDVFKVLASSHYFPSDSAIQQSLAGRRIWRLRDPLYNVPVLVSETGNPIYHSHTALLALIFAELVDNAAHYVHDYLGLGRTASVHVAFARNRMSITNPILRGAGEAVRARLEDARSTVGHSLNRVINLAGQLQCQIEFKFLSDNRVRFTCRFVQ